MMCQGSSSVITEEKPPDKAGEEGQVYALHYNKRRCPMHSIGSYDRMVAASGCTAGGYVLHIYICAADSDIRDCKGLGTEK